MEQDYSYASLENTRRIIEHLEAIGQREQSERLRLQVAVDIGDRLLFELEDHNLNGLARVSGWLALRVSSYSEDPAGYIGGGFWGDRSRAAELRTMSPNDGMGLVYNALERLFRIRNERRSHSATNEATNASKIHRPGDSGSLSRRDLATFEKINGAGEAGITPGQLRQALHLSTGTLREMRKTLEAYGLIASDGRGSAVRYYSVYALLPESEETS